MKKMTVSLLTGLIIAGIAGNVMAQSWTENISMKGDVRFRYQNTDDEKAPEARERWRYRGRLSLSGKVNDQMKAGIRLVTNQGDPISDNTTMGGIGEPGEDAVVRIDRAYFDWSVVEGANLIFGKMSQPWNAVADLIMSGDVNPEGMAAKYAMKADAVSMMLNGGAFVLKERKTDDETMLFSGQVAGKFNTGEKSYIMAGASVYAFDNIKGNEELNKFGKNSTETVGEDDDAVSVYATDYNVVEGFVEAGMNLGSIPLTIGAQYAVNTEADDNDTAYLGTFAAKLPNNFALGYQYRYVEADAIFGGWAEDTDFGNGGTDLKGHIPYVKYKINKNFDLKAQYAMGQKGVDNGTDIDTFKIDLVAKF